MTNENELQYNFYKSELWTGRLPSIINSIDSNRKLLRVILLTKGSSISQFGSQISKKNELLGNDSAKKLEEMNSVLSEETKEVNDKIIAVQDKIAEVKRRMPKAEEIIKKVKKVDDGMSNVLGMLRKKDSPSPIESTIADAGILPLFHSYKDTLDTSLKTLKDKSNNLAQSKTALENSLKNLTAPLDKLDFEAKQLRHIDTLTSALKEFVDERLRKSVVNAFGDKDENNPQTPPRVDLIREIFQNVATDSEIIQRAIVQRVNEIDDKGKYVTSTQAKALQMMDKLALKALHPFKHLLSIDNIVPITYFSQKTHIHRVPYNNNIILIGMRYAQVLQEIKAQSPENPSPPDSPPPFELLAIPHEIGHYIYKQENTINLDNEKRKNLQTDVTKLDSEKWGRWLVGVDLDEIKTLADLTETFPAENYHGWCEEIFSDICGCIVAGDLAALGMQFMLASRPDGDNHKHDGTHPTGILRPFILSEILNVLSKLDGNKYNLKKQATKLSKNWERILRKFGHSVTDDNNNAIITTKPKPKDHFETPHEPDDDHDHDEHVTNLSGNKEHKINVAEELNAIRPIIHVFARILLDHYTESAKPTASGKTYDLWHSDNSDLKSCGFEMSNLKVQKVTELDLSDADDVETLKDEWCINGPVTYSDHSDP